MTIGKEALNSGQQKEWIIA